MYFDIDIEIWMFCSFLYLPKLIYSILIAFELIIIGFYIDQRVSIGPIIL